MPVYKVGLGGLPVWAVLYFVFIGPIALYLLLKVDLVLPRAVSPLPVRALSLTPTVSS